MKSSEIMKKYKINGALTGKKLMKYLPFMIMTNLSTLLLVSVDGIVVGNFVGTKALSSVNIFSPIVVVIGVLSNYFAAGISTQLSVCMGTSDMDGISRVKDASKKIMIAAACFVAVIQLPIVFGLIESYGLSSEMKSLTWNYAIGVMISMPFGMISTIGVCQLQIVGKMRALMVLSAVEGMVNLGLDLLFVAGLDMGVAGAGYGTALANIVRATATVVYLHKKTKIFSTSGIKSSFEDIKKILYRGVPELSSSVMLAIQNYLIVIIVLYQMGENGGAIRGVCVFALSLALVAINGIQGSMRPLVGILTGSEDWRGLRILFRQTIKLITIIVGILTVLVLVFPEIVFTIHGIDKIPAYGVASLRLFALHFLIKGYDAIFRLYFANRGNAKFSSVVTIAGSATMPLFAYIFGMLVNAEWLWFGYFMAEGLILIANVIKYKKIVSRDVVVDKEIGRLYMTIMPDEAVEASRELRKYAKEKGVSDRIAYRLSLCVEEMIAYARTSQKNKDISVQVIIKFLKNEAVFLMIDDGECIALNEDKETKEIIMDNYELIKKVAHSIDYKYMLDMNHTMIKI